MPDPQLLMCQVTDQYGHVESEPLVVRLEAGWAFLEFEGQSWMVDADELRAALVPRREVRAA
jgi:hypothetical protein